jgi:hypothetical protein
VKALCSIDKQLTNKPITILDARERLPTHAINWDAPKQLIRLQENARVVDDKSKRQFQKG